MDRETGGEEDMTADRTFDVSAFRESMERGLQSLAEDTFRTLGGSGSRTLLQQIVALALSQIVDSGNRTIAASAIVAIWREEEPKRIRHVIDACLMNDDAAIRAQVLLDHAWVDDEPARILEELLLFAEADVLTEKAWHSREWLLVQLRREVMQWHLRSKLLRLNIVVPSEQRSTRASARGLLELSTSASKTLLTAGDEFSVFVTVRNPYDVPVTLYTVETQIPVEFEDVVWKQRRRLELLTTEDKLTGEDKEPQISKGLFAGLWNITVDRWRQNLQMAAETQPRIAQAVTPTEASELREKSLRVEANVHVGDVMRGSVTGVQIEQYQPITVASASPEQIDSVLWRLTAFRHGLVPVVLQPGDSVVKQFIFRTTSWLFFRPLAHTLNIEVRYSVDGRDHVAAAVFNLVVQAALRATLIGGVLGGVLGGVARALSQADTTHTSLSIRYVSIILAAILSAVAVVSLARKSNAQQIISVEDFWGGLFLGFLIGFFGQQFAIRLLQPGASL